MLVSILVLFFLLRLIPSMPMPGEPRALGLDRAWSDVRFSARTAPTQETKWKVKTQNPFYSLSIKRDENGVHTQEYWTSQFAWLLILLVCIYLNSKANVIYSGGFRDKPASLSHFSSNGLSLHMFLKLRFKASKREMVVWLKSFPYSFPMARPTSPY